MPVVLSESGRKNKFSLVLDQLQDAAICSSFSWVVLDPLQIDCFSRLQGCWEN